MRRIGALRWSTKVATANQCAPRARSVPRLPHPAQRHSADSVRQISSGTVQRVQRDPSDVVPPWDTLPQMMSSAVESYTNNPLFGTKNLVTGEYQWMTYGEFGELYARFRAGLLQRTDVKKGDKIAIVSKNRVEWAAAAAAGYSLGCPIVPMYENQSPADWSHILQDSGAKILCVSTADVSQRCDGLGGAVLSGIDSKICFESDASAGCDATFDQVIGLGVEVGEGPDAERIASNEIRELTEVGMVTAAQTTILKDDLATLIYTSGTTGSPKGVMLSHGNILSNVGGMHIVAGERLSPSTRTLSFLPWAHVFGQTIELFGVMSVGGAIGLAEAPATLLDDIQKVKPTMLVAVPVVFTKIYDKVHDSLTKAGGLKAKAFSFGMLVARKRREWLDSPVETRPRYTPLLWCQWQLVHRLIFASVTNLLGGELKMCLTGGAALSPVVQQWYSDLGIPIVEGYGLTETSPIVVVERPAPTEHLQGGMRPLPGVTVLLCKPNVETGAMEEVPHGQEGEICVVGPNVMLGYFKNEAATAEVLIDLPGGERGFRTGDLGRFVSGDRLQITGRANEQYKLENGKFVVPGPIEDTLRLWSPFVDQALVYGLNQPYNVMLVVPEVEAVARHLNLVGDEATPEAIVANPKVVQLLEQEMTVSMDRMRAEGIVPSYAAPRRLLLSAEPFSVDNGLLTPKLSMKRPAIIKKYAAQLASLYDQ